MAQIGGMLAQTGANIGTQLGQAGQQFGRDIGGMLSRVGAGMRERRSEREIQEFLQANQNDVDALEAKAQELLVRRDPMASVVQQAAKAAATRRQQKQTEATGRGTGELLALASDPAFDINNPTQRSGYLGMADSFGISRGEAMKLALEQKNQRSAGGSSFRQEIFDPTSGTMKQVNFLTDNSGRVVGQQILGASSGPEKADISIQKEGGVFYVFENGVKVAEYESREAASQAAKERNKANEAILKAQRVKLSIADAISMIENNQNVGGWKQLLRYLPDTEARRFENYLTSIKANVGFDQLLQIKDAGSTLGQVSNIENLLLQSTIDSLDGLMNQQDLIQALNKIDAYYESLITKAKYGPDAKLKDWAASVDWMNPEFARMYEQQGGEIVVNENERSVLVKSPNGESIKLLR